MRTDLVKLLLLLIVLAVVVILAGYFGRGEQTPGKFDQSDRSRQEESGHTPPGRFDYYLLVLGWSPTYCASERHDRSNQQCETQHPRTFVLHGAMAAIRARLAEGLCRRRSALGASPGHRQNARRDAEHPPHHS